MSKRFTDTNKFDDPWYCNLSNDAKLAWEYILAKCDNSGVWEPNFRIANAYLSVSSSWEDIRKEFGDRVVVLPSGKWWAWKFIAFQYGELSESCKPHLNIIRLLKQNGIYDIYQHHLLTREPISRDTSKKENTLSKGYPKGIKTLEEKDKDKEEEKDKDKEEETRETINRKSPKPQAELIYSEYPKKVGKPVAIKAIEKQLVSYPFELLMGCTKRFAESQRGDTTFTPHPATWFNQERFNDDPETWERQVAPVSRNNMTASERMAEKRKGEYSMKDEDIDLAILDPMEGIKPEDVWT